MENAGLKGALREILIADLFRPLLPTDIGVATGLVISSFHNKQSAQQDIVLFDRRILPPLLFERGLAIIPVEAALVTVEVKSCLSATELKKAIENARLLRDLDLLGGIRDDGGKFADVQTSGPQPLLFALESDLSSAGKTEVQRCAELNGDGPALLRGICIAGKGSWWPQRKAILDKPSGRYLSPDGKFFTGKEEWHEVPPDKDHQEVLAMLAGVHDMTKRIAETRGWPPLRGYLHPGPDPEAWSEIGSQAQDAKPPTLRPTARDILRKLR